MQKNTAGKWIVFAFEDEGGTNPGEPVTGDAANITANIRIDGGAANAVDDTNPTELEDGYYVFDITAVESNGDLLLIAPQSSTANVNVIGVPGAVWTTPANFNDLSVTSTTGRVDVDSVGGTSQTANDNGADINTLLTRVVGTIAAGTHNAQSGDSYARLGAPAGASVSADIATVDGNVDAILVDTADMQPKLGTITDLGGGATVGANLSDMAGATFSSTTDSQEAIRDRGDAAWTTGAGGSDRLLMVDTTIATLSTQTSFTLTAGSSDDDAYNNCTIVIEDASTSTQKAVGMVLDYTGSTKTVTLKEALAFTIATTDKVYILAENSLKSTVANRQLDVTANGTAGIDWANIENPTTAVDLSGTDIQLVDTCTTNTDMRGTDSANTTTPPTAAAIADAVLDEALSGHTTAGTLGKAVADTETDATAILADTNELQGDWTNGGRLDLLVDAIKAVTDALPDAGALTTIDTNIDSVLTDTGTTLPATLAALNDISTADVNAQVLDVLNTDTFAEPTGVPAATASLVTKLGYIYMALRNRVDVTATKKTFYDDGGSAEWEKDLSDDGTTYSESEGNAP